MRILVEPSGYPEVLNLGDMAMQQVALTRLAAMWPKADIQVFTDAPDKLPFYANGVRPLSTAGRHAWLSGWAGSAHTRGPIRRAVAECEGILRRRAPVVLKSAIRLKMILRRRDPRQLDEFFEAVGNADVLVVCGMGGVADVFKGFALDLLDTIALAKTNVRTKVAMFGQGLGPMAVGSEVYRRAAEVLPLVDLIALREGRFSPQLLDQLGVARERVLITGDDAIEAALCQSQSTQRDSLGVSLRVADYSNVGADDAEEIRKVLANFRQNRPPLRLVQLPTSRFTDEDDSSVLAKLVGDPPEIAEPITDLDGLKKRISRCRVVVAGSYHAAVFALSQGVPAVCLEKHPYYHDKFNGLKVQFGDGVFVVSMSEPGWQSRLASVLEEAWSKADELSPKLIAAGNHQVELSREAYRKFFELVEASEAAGPSTPRSDIAP